MSLICGSGFYEVDGVFVACLAVLMCVAVCVPANAQNCQNRVCPLGAPVVAVPGPYFGGPVVLQPALVFISPGICQGPGGAAVPCHSPEMVYGCLIQPPSVRPASFPMLRPRSEGLQGSAEDGHE
jgi:hypothetical protein